MNALHAVASLPAVIAEVSAGVVLRTVEEPIRCAGKKADTVGAGASVMGGEQEFAGSTLGPILPPLP